MQVFAPIHPMRSKRLRERILGYGDSLYGYWPMWEQSGGVAYNYAPQYRFNGSNGTVTGATQGARGRLGNAYSFDGVNDTVEIPIDFPGYDFPTTYSIGLFFHHDSLPGGNPRIVTCSTSGTNGFRIGIFFNGEDLRFVNFEGSSNTVTISTAISVGEAVFYCVTMTTNSCVVYKNGSSVGSDTSCAVATPEENLFVGQTSTPNNAFAGRIQHMFMTTTVLSAAEVAHLSRIIGTS